MRYAGVVIIVLVLSLEAFSQESLVSEQSMLERRTEIAKMPADEEKKSAEKFAGTYNLPVRVRYRDGTVMEIMKISKTGQPMYYKTFNLDAARTVSSDLVWEGGPAGLDLNGAGIVVGMWDEGVARASHNEFGGRARVIDPESEISDHATHVAGTVGAAGVREQAHGMASEGMVDSYNWGNDNAEMRSAAQQGMLISNNSYGYVQGWDYNQDKSRWEWWGDESISKKEDYKFGYYSDDARTWDDIAYRNPRFLIIKSVGNDRSEGPAPGAQHYVFKNNAWVPSTETRELDGGPDAFDCIGTQSTSKNILSVGAVDDIPGGYQDISDVEVASFSAFGPTDDGRIKPDIVGNGVGLLSSTSDGDDSYGFSSGTSMSAPNISGSLALLQQHYKNLNDGFLFACQLKALVLHTADDAGKKGPDYKYGWGLMNTLSAAEIISRSDRDLFFLDTLLDQETRNLTFYSSGLEEIRITMVWTDPPGEVPPAGLNPTGRILVNDLDIRLTRLIDGHLFRPFVLDPANPSYPAVPGDNTRDNVEQIYIEKSLRGLYSLDISHKGSLSEGEQPFAIVISGLTKDFIASGFNKKEDPNGTILLSSADQYINNMDVQWLIEPRNGMPVSLYFDFFETEQDQDILTIYDGMDQTAPVIARFSGNMSVMDTLVSSTSGQMFVTFTSDDQVTSRGFQARYCTVEPQGAFSIVGEPYPCQFSTSSYFAIGQDGTEYAWEVDQDWPVEPKNSNGIDLSIGDTGSILTLQPFNRCGEADTTQFQINPLSNLPELDSLAGDTLPCANHPALLTVNPLPGTAYEWQLPDSWLGSSESDTLHYIPSGTGGEVTVTGRNACGKGNPLSVYINVLDIPGETNILTERVPPCAGTLQEFYVEALPGYS